MVAISCPSSNYLLSSVQISLSFWIYSSYNISRSSLKKCQAMVFPYGRLKINEATDSLIISFPSLKARDQVAGNCETTYQMFVSMPFAVVKLFYIPFIVHIIIVFSVFHCYFFSILPCNFSETASELHSCLHSDLFSVREQLRILFVVLRLTHNKIGM